ncbi:hypothetical protein [Thermococcus cleftensis]|uniref:hypothetical protein n=1 Tax=Thermococcus cleftensis (strain DSM 27260 / KACC 17922 / CL1) TaxID=163003 RepID=UPI00064EF5E3|nr:hypothetical protein [Thermococcus cleftensis]
MKTKKKTKTELTLIIETSGKVPKEAIIEALEEYMKRKKIAEKLYSLLEGFDWDAIENTEKTKK